MNMTFNEAFYKIGWAAITAVVIYTGTQVKEMSTSISQLNLNVAVMVEKVAQGTENQRALSTRVELNERQLRDLEIKINDIRAELKRTR